MKARRRLIILIAVVAIGVGGWVLWPRSTGPAGSIQASGTIEATQVGVAPKIAGRVIKIAVHEGQQVEAGQHVAGLGAAEGGAQATQGKHAAVPAPTRPAQAHTVSALCPAPAAADTR